MERKCFECGEPLRGRSDKKFCSDNCRNAHNNRLNSDCSKVMRNINNILRRNRSILEELFGRQLFLLQKDQLSERGFNFNFVTHQKPIEEGMIGQFCYEYGYTISERQSIMVVQEPELEQYKSYKLKDLDSEANQEAQL